MKKILILNGAGRKNGKTAAMVKAFADAASANGNEIIEFFLHDMNIAGCINCDKCKLKDVNSPEPCAQKDDMNEIYPAIRKADVIVFASPVYFWDITGTLKTAVDRLHALVPYFRTQVYKETVLLMTSGGSKIDHVKEWCHGFERWFGWKSLGEAMNDMEKARAIGASIK